MKKSLVALAVLAASGASFAQSNVTLYGLADIWLGSVKETHGVTGHSVRTTKLDSGGVNGSRWGMKGSEDLGGGLKAIFKLEQGFKLDTGAGDTAGQAFSRQAYVGFAGGFGEVQLGKVWTAFDDVWGASNAVFDSALSPTHHVFESINYIDRTSNGLRYSTPQFGGFAGAVSYSLDEKVIGAAKVASFSVTYGAGPLAAQLGYQVEDVVNGVGQADTKYLILGGSYNFGMATAKANYAQVKNVGNLSGADTKEYQLGVDFPVSSVITVSASYAKSDDNVKNGDQTRQGYGIGATYTLSKRTFLYGGYTANKSSNFRAGDDKLDILALGVQHKF